MTEYLSMKPYKVQFVQKLDEEDSRIELICVKTLISTLEDNDTQESLVFLMKLLSIYLD